MGSGVYTVATQIWQLNNLIINVLTHKSSRVKSIVGLFTSIFILEYFMLNTLTIYSVCVCKRYVLSANVLPKKHKKTFMNNQFVNFYYLI